MRGARITKVENVYTIFQKRGFVEQVTDKEQVVRLLETPTTCYIGFDPTAKSLHVGSLVPIMSLAHMQKAGHRPIALIGGGTGLVGDPSGKTEMRQILSRERIDENAMGLKKQLSRFMDFAENAALMLNNADWLTSLGYIDFLRDIGRHFSVNRMLTAESYRARLEKGLNFIEFNYMLLQAYDFWHLFKHYDCRLQMGGNDQWGNILAGADLTRRIDGELVQGLTFPLLTTSSGIKMGKTHKGAVWLNAELTTPYEYYQYWINQDDRDVERFLALFTFLPMEQIEALCGAPDSDIRKAKETLAYEATCLCHGKAEADLAKKAAKELFGSNQSSTSESIPSHTVPETKLSEGIPAFILFEISGLCNSRGAARRLIAQGGGYMNGQKIEIFDQIIDAQNLENNVLMLRAGKKRHMKIVVDK